MMAYPISRGRFVNFVAFEFNPHEEETHFDGPWVADVNPSYVQGLFHGWEKEVDELVQVSAWPVESIARIQSANKTFSVFG
jgi:salicylate hydroxylase